MTCRYREGYATSTSGHAMANYQEREALAHDRALYYAVDAPDHIDGRQYENGLLIREAECFSKVRADLDPALARRLGIDTSRATTVGEFGNLLWLRQTDGKKIGGRQYQGEVQSIKSVCGLSSDRMLTSAEIDHVLAGRRADGGTPKDEEGKLPLSQGRIDGARRRFLSVLRVADPKDPRPEEIEAIRNGLSARGDAVKQVEYFKRIAHTRPQVGFIDLSFHPDKSVTACAVMARTPAERGIYRKAVEGAAQDAMAWVEREIGFTRRGKEGRLGVEPGKLVWMTCMHDTSRPVSGVTDPHLHAHVLLLNHVLTANSHLGSLDLDRIKGLTKQFGAMFHVHVARRLREHGISVSLDQKSGAAVIDGVSQDLCKAFSTRRVAAEAQARKAAEDAGLDWKSLSERQKAEWIDYRIENHRNRKNERGDLAEWRVRGMEADPNFRSPLGRHKSRQPMDESQRIEVAVAAAEPMIADRLSREAAIRESDVREMLIRGFIKTGIGDPSRDIDSAMDRLCEQGIRIGKEHTKLVFGAEPTVRGKTRRSVTTDLAIARETQAIETARTMNADHSKAFPQHVIDRHIEAASIKLSPEQKRVASLFLGAGRMELAIGWAGAGKTTALKVPVAAWREAGTEVYGVAQAWKQAKKLRGAGIDDDKCLAVDKLLHDVKAGRVTISSDTVIVVDEVARLGVRQWRDLLNAAKDAKLVALGDPKQCVAIEHSDVVELMSRALPHAIPELVHSLRQKDSREREITALLRDPEGVSRALAMKREDGSFELALGEQKTIDTTASRWMERRAANKDDPDFTITASVPTNSEARAVGEAVRRLRKQQGELGEDRVVLRATDPNAKETFDLRLAPGDKVRLFDRVFDANQKGPRQSLGSNGDVVDVLSVSERGMVIRSEDGSEGLVEWRKLRDSPRDPVRLTLGYCMTIDTMQGMDATENISAYPSGTGAVNLGKSYTAGSRHERVNHLIINESAERQQIAQRTAWSGVDPVIRTEDVHRNIADNMARWVRKSVAMDVLDRSARSANDGAAILHALEPGQRRKLERVEVGVERTAMRIQRYVHKMQLAPERTMRWAVDVADTVRKRVARRSPEMRQHQGPAMRM